MRNKKITFWCVLGMACVALNAVAAEGVVSPSATSGVGAPAAKKRFNSLEAYFSTTSTPQEDYFQGTAAYDRGEMIEAQGLFERAANKGHSGAQARLAEILDRSEFNLEAFQWYQKSAAQGDVDGMYGLVTMFIGGEGVEVNIPEARRFAMLAAQGGHEMAMTMVWRAFVKGGLGLTVAERTNAETLKWLQLAVDAGDANAMAALGNGYAAGSFGLPVDAVKAAEWTKKSRDLKGIKEEVKKKAKKRRI
jgi:uncharacterized protein